MEYVLKMYFKCTVLYSIDKKSVLISTMSPHINILSYQYFRVTDDPSSTGYTISQEWLDEGD